jgi:hypothetical protein
VPLCVYVRVGEKKTPCSPVVQCVPWARRGSSLLLAEALLNAR